MSSQPPGNSDRPSLRPLRGDGDAPTAERATAPPSVRGVTRKSIILVACGIILAGLLLLVVAQIDPPEERGTDPDELRELTRDIPTHRLTDEDLDGARTFDQTAVDLPEGGWIQISNEQGGLAQQYRFERLDPNPDGMGPGWVRLVQPEIEVYGSGGSVVSLSGDTALAFTPNNFVESGKLNGNVLIQRYEVEPGTVLDAARHEPSLLVRTPEAEFDNILGDVRAAQRIDVETTGGTFTGRGLTLLFNDQTGVIQRLDVAEVESIRLATGGASEPASASTSASASAPASESATNETTTGPGAATVDAAGSDPSASPTGAVSAIEPADDDADAQTDETAEIVFYRLTLRDQVQVRQGRATAQRRADGDELTLIFTSQSDTLAPSIALGPTPDLAGSIAHAPLRPPLPPPLPPHVSGPRRLENVLYGTLFAMANRAERRIAPEPRDDDTIITCTGGLTMSPLSSSEPRPNDPRDARLELVGDPVRLDDMAAETNAVCRMVRYDALPARVDLIGSSAEPVDVRGPRFRATTAQMWVSRRDQVGGFIGAGAIGFPQEAPPRGGVGALAGGGGDQAPKTEDRLHIAWKTGGDLGFADAEGSDMIGPLRSASFDGDVRVTGRDPESDPATNRVDEGTSGTLECQHLALRFRPAPDGRTADDGAGVDLEHLHANGDVAVRDVERSLWAQELDVWFVAIDDPESGQTEIDRIVAAERVAVALEGGRHVLTDRMEIGAVARTAVFEGSDVTLVDGGNVIDRASLIRIDETQEHYELVGSGRFRRYDRPALAADITRLRPAAIAELETAAHALMITWTGGVEIAPMTPTPDDAATAGRTARFDGQVIVDSPELRMDHADTLIVTMATDDTAAGPEDGEAIRSIDATGAVYLRSVGDPGELRCEHLHVDLERTDSERAVPRHLRADGGVQIRDPDQIMWSSTLDVTFRPVEDDGKGAGDGDARPRVAIDEVVAKSDVQVRLANGERAFADRLLADGQRETAWLEGERILVVNGARVLDRGTRLVLERQTGRYRVEGSGEFFELGQSLVLGPVDARVPRPDVTGVRVMEAAWRDSAQYFDRGDDGGTLELEGAVHAESRPSDTELNVIDSDFLALDFDAIEEPADDDDDGEEQELELARMTARGTARIESRTWRDAIESGPPRVYYIAGDDVQYDQRTLEARVNGPGELLIRDEWDAEKETESAHFAGKGTTLLRWRDGLTMTRLADAMVMGTDGDAMTRHVEEQFRIAMDGGAEVLHRDVAGLGSTLTGQHVEADVWRSSASTAPATAAVDGAMRLGGPMEVRRLRGRGGLTVRTPARDVLCDDFDYDLASGLAEAGAVPGRMVSVLEANAAEPVQHGRIVWNMRDDTITVYRGSASASP